MKSLHQEQSGFTIVELIVTLIVGGILAGGISTILSTHSSLSQRGRDVTVANSYAENKIESLRSAGYLGLTNGTTNLTSELPSELKAPRSGSMTISDVSAAIKKVDITVTYSDQGAARTYSYSTYIGELGVGQY